MDKPGPDWFCSWERRKRYSIKTILMLRKKNINISPDLLLSIDAEKAFDRVDWGFMMIMLQHLGMGPKIMKGIKNLYNGPTARVRVNGKTSPVFEMFNGTRQGCPLSPFLYVLSQEPFLATLRNNQGIEGARVEEKRA